MFKGVDMNKICRIDRSTSGQNVRELWQNIMHFKKPDRIPLINIESMREAIPRWHIEGLPPAMDVRDYLGLDHIEWVPISFLPIPTFVRRILKEDSNYRIEVDDLGIKKKVLKKNPGLVYNYLEHPVKDRNDWEKMKERFDPHDIRRYPMSWGDELVQYYNTADHPIGLLIHPFFFRIGLYSMGLIKFLTTFYDNPELIHDMFSFWADFTIELTREILGRVNLDFVSIAEDMAYKSAPHVSPEMYKQFWLPHQRRVIEFIKSSDVEVLSFWNSGNIQPLIPLLLEAGFNCFWPFEDMAGMNAVDMRRKYGKKVLLVGNIAKEALIKGKEAIEKEVYSKVPYLMEAGGYIPAVDDEMPPEVPFQNYVYYIELLKKLSIKLR